MGFCVTATCTTSEIRSDLAALAHEVGPDTESRLVAAVYTLLGIDTIGISSAPMGPAFPYEAAVTGVLAGPVEAGVAATGAHPHVLLDSEVIRSKSVDDGQGNISVEYEVSNNFTAQPPEGVQLREPRIVMPRDPEAEYGPVAEEFIAGAVRVHHGEESITPASPPASSAGDEA